MTGKFKIAVSDVHVGAGDLSRPNPLEDFTADESFARLLADIKTESEQTGKEVEFIINGDFFEFLQVPAVDNFDPLQTYPPEAYRDSSAEASVKRLNIIAAMHPDIFSGFADFLHDEAPVRQITITRGNHDVNLFWPLVQTRLREILGATGEHSSLLTFAEEFINREGIYVEHGCQRAEKVNRIANFSNPVSPEDPNQLLYPPGSHFVINYFNQAERKIWWLDNIKPITSLFWYVFKWDFYLAMELLLGMVKNVPGLIVGSFDADSTSPVNTLTAQLEDPARRETLAQEVSADPARRREVQALAQQILTNAGLPGRIHAQAIDDDPLKMAEAEQAAIQGVFQEAAESITAEGKAKVALFGHNHLPELKKLKSGGYYVNTGAWLWAEEMGHATQETWDRLMTDPESFTHSRRLPYARIDYDDAGHPQPSLIDFATDKPIIELPDTPKGCFGKLWDRIQQLFGAG